MTSTMPRVGETGPVADVRVLLICVNYQSDDLATRLVESVLHLDATGQMRILVVDNSALDGESDLSRRLTNERVEVSVPARNLGYFGAAAHGLALFQQDNRLPDWVIVSNADLRIEDKDFFTRLMAYPVVPTLGVTAPAIQSELSGHDQNPYLLARPSSKRMMFYKRAFDNYWLYTCYSLLGAFKDRVQGLIGSRPANRRRKVAGRRRIYAPHGSFMIFTRQYFDGGGNFNYPAFLFGEEIFVAETAKRIGLEIVYDPALRVVHNEHVSTKIVKPRSLARHAAISAAYCADTYFA